MNSCVCVLCTFHAGLNVFHCNCFACFSCFCFVFSYLGSIHLLDGGGGGGGGLAGEIPMSMNVKSPSPHFIFF